MLYPEITSLVVLSRATRRFPSITRLMLACFSLPKSLFSGDRVGSMTWLRGRQAECWLVSINKVLL